MCRQLAPIFTGTSGIVLLSGLFFTEQNNTCICALRAQPLVTCSNLQRTIPGNNRLFTSQRFAMFGPDRLQDGADVCDFVSISLTYKER
jgi:hypothetical protein